MLPLISQRTAVPCHSGVGRPPCNVQHGIQGPRRVFNRAANQTGVIPSGKEDGAKPRATAASDQGSSTIPDSVWDDPKWAPEGTTPKPSTPAQGTTPPQEGPSIFSRPATVRRMLLAATASEAVELMQEDEVLGAGLTVLQSDDCCRLLASALEQGNVDLALSIYAAMGMRSQSRSSPGRSQRSGTAAPATGIRWPAITLEATTTLVLGLARALRVSEALDLINALRTSGVPGAAAELSFGMVVGSPLAVGKPLTVVQPQEGVKVVGDAFSRYELEVFSGSVVGMTSEDLNRSPNPLVNLLRQAGVWKSAPVGAVHEFCVQAPDGTARTFRVGSETADVPAQVGDRVSVVCSPTKGSSRYRRLLAPTPPGTRPGQPLQLTNHKTRVVTDLLRPPPSTSTGTPSWLVPAAILLAGSDAATYLIDPTLPALIAGGVAAAAATSVAGSTLVVPRLKQLPDGVLKVEYMRQQLLAQYRVLGGKMEAMVAESCEDVRTLARLWQLQAKMDSVAGGHNYSARRERVESACGALEDRVVKQLELLEGYSRVMAMIEIEVEMETEVPAAEFAGIERQIDRLVELEGLQEDWKLQAEARDEVERLLRAA